MNALNVASSIMSSIGLPHRGNWRLADLHTVPNNGKTVFSCFHCGGGSTMGYKLAGYNVLGGVEIDPKMMEIYRNNHNPKHSYLMGVQEFKDIPNEDLPKELFNLDILDGSPPCSVFSTAGKREEGWGVEKVFREGQAKQRLDDLFFHFIDIANKLKPRVVVAENVTGMLKGKAKGYVKQIFTKFRECGYEPQLFRLDASKMGVPQKRERIFFIAQRKEEHKPISLSFNEEVVTLRDALQGLPSDNSKYMKYLDKGNKSYAYWANTLPGEFLDSGAIRLGKKPTFFTCPRYSYDKPVPTVVASGSEYMPSEYRSPTFYEYYAMQSFPLDYDALTTTSSGSKYITGMSVPPFMVQRIALEIEKQILARKAGDKQAIED